MLRQLSFQLSPLHERRPVHLYFPVFILNFNSCLYTRGDVLRPVYICNQNFNSRLYIRGDTNKLPIAAEEEIFQFTPLHERQLQKYTIFSIKSTQFSTKPCFFIVTSRKAVFFSIPVQYFL